ncbi:hypothetical protein SDC9_154371 [bioreactor metagenome]|uniref:Uncharacterized protein n=1 Tax=bioreactor metagenome TaxID=1076179 RepID=A0A645EYI1_9ZZZZ
MALSPWQELIFKSSQERLPPQAAAPQSQKAELDQSPSVAMLPGEINLSVPDISIEPSFTCVFMLKVFRTSRVISIYPPDSTGPDVFILLSFSRSGRAIRSPLMNCELTSPGISNSPAVSLPENETLSLPLPSMDIPPLSRASHNGAMGLSASLPRRMNVGSAPSTAATGERNLYVDPLSPQSSTAPLFGEVMGVTEIRPSLKSMLAPSAERHLTVALMSSEITLQQIFVSLSARAAQISCLCAKDFDGIARTVPFIADDRTVTLIALCRPSRRSPLLIQGL